MCKMLRILVFILEYLAAVCSIFHPQEVLAQPEAVGVKGARTCLCDSALTPHQ